MKRTPTPKELPVTRLTALVAFIILLAATSAQLRADDAQQLFDSLYAVRLQQVRKTIDRTDDIKLAEEWVRTAGGANVPSELLVLLCKSAHKLTSKTTGGLSVAISAMRLMADKVETKRGMARQAILKLLPRHIATSTGQAKTDAIERLVKLSITMGDEQSQAGEIGRAHV